MKRDPAASGEPAPKPRGAFAIACRYLTSRERCAAQVAKFLERHAYGTEEIEEAIRLLREKRFIDDFRYARQYVDVRSRRSPRSGAWLVRELIARGIDRETAQRAVDDLLQETSEEDLARRLLSRMGGRGRPDLAQRAAQRLCSRGFNASIAFAWAKEQDRGGEAATGITGIEEMVDEDAHFLNEDNEE
jgi:SOS response regulatory protein OraA/RecX